MRTLIILFFLGVKTLVFTQGIAFETDWKTAREKGKKEKKLIFVDYCADWMSDFYRLTKVLYSDTAIGDYFNQNFIAVRINTEKEEGKRLSDAYNLFQSPRFLFIHADNLDVIARENITNKKEDFLGIAKKAFQYKDITPLSILQKNMMRGKEIKPF
jgi:hypothetical protein